MRICAYQKLTFACFFFGKKYQKLKGYFTHFKQISKLSNIDKLIFIKHNPKFSQSSHVVFLLFTLTI